MSDRGGRRLIRHAHARSAVRQVVQIVPAGFVRRGLEVLLAVPIHDVDVGSGA